MLGYQRRPFRVASPWFTGDADIVTYQPDELCATKLRALYQRSKGREPPSHCRLGRSPVAIGGVGALGGNIVVPGPPRWSS